MLHPVPSAPSSSPPGPARRSRPAARLIAGLALALTLASCGEVTKEQLVEDRDAILAEMSDVLASIQDSHTARAAEAELERLGERLVELEERARAKGVELMESPEAKAAMARARSALDRAAAKVQEFADSPEVQQAWESASSKVRELLGTSSQQR